MSVVNQTHYKVMFKNGDCLEHIDLFNLSVEEVVEGLLLLNSASQEAIKQVLVTYEYQKPTLQPVTWTVDDGQSALGDLKLRPMIRSVSVWREPNGIFKKQPYVIQINEENGCQKKTYESAFSFWKAFFTVCEHYGLMEEEQLILSRAVEINHKKKSILTLFFMI